MTNMGAHYHNPDDIYTKDLVSVPLDMHWSFVSDSQDSGASKSASTQTIETDRRGCKFQVTFLPLICSEALQTMPGPTTEYDVVVIPSYNGSAEAFDSIIDQLSRTQHVVVFANDGLYGGSRFAIPPSGRGDGWWLAHPNNGKLPTGDGLIVADVTPMSALLRSM